jgi:hypothetical protein
LEVVWRNRLTYRKRRGNCWKIMLHWRKTVVEITWKMLQPFKSA